MSPVRLPASLLALLLLAAVAAPAAAEPAAPATAEVNVGKLQLEPIRVAADAEPDPLVEPTVLPADQKLATVVMPREEFERRSPFKMTEALRFIAPNVVHSRQNRKYRNFFDVRGDRSSVTVDGFLVQDGSSNGGMRGDDRLLEFMDPGIVESIELVKDSSALILGTARGGVMRIRTRKPDRAESTRFLEFGSDGLVNARITTMDRTAWGAYYAAVSDHRYDGPKNKNAEENYRDLFLKLYYDATPKDELRLTVDRSVGMCRIPVDEPLITGQLNPTFVKNTTSLVTTAANGWAYDPWTNTLLDLDWKHDWSARQSTDLQLTRLSVENDFHNPRGIGAKPIGHLDGHHVEETTTALALRHTLKFRSGWIARAGYYFDHWENPTGKLYWENRANEDEKESIYLQNEVPLAGDRLKLDFGWRRDGRHIVREEKSRLSGTATKLAVIENQDEDPRDSFSTGLTWKADDDTTVSARVGSLTVTPVDRTATLTGAALSDEKDSILNVGVEHAFRAAKHGLKLSLNFFRNKLDDAIVDDTTATRYADPPTNSIMIRTFKNQDTVQKGGELALTAGLGPRTDLTFGVGRITYEPELKTLLTGSTSTKPRKNCNVSLRHRAPGDVELELYGGYVGPYDTAVSLITVPAAGAVPATTKQFLYRLGDFWDLNLSAAKKLDEYATVRLSVKNMTGKQYETTAMTPNYGRQTSLSYELKF